MSRRKVSSAAADHSNALTMAAGFGFESDIVDGKLQLVQRDSDGEPSTDVTLSPTEAKVLFAKYASWAGLELSESAS